MSMFYYDLKNNRWVNTDMIEHTSRGVPTQFISHSMPHHTIEYITASDTENNQYILDAKTLKVIFKDSRVGNVYDNATSLYHRESECFRFKNNFRYDIPIPLWTNKSQSLIIKISNELDTFDYLKRFIMIEIINE